MKSFTVNGNPLSTQHCYKISCRGKFARLYMDKKCVDLKASYRHEMIVARTECIDVPIEVEAKLYFGTKRKVDIDNFQKLWMDAGNGILWEDDVLIQKLTVSKHYDKSNPRIEILIKKL